jgi:hypothetical protein
MHASGSTPGTLPHEHVLLICDSRGDDDVRCIDNRSTSSSMRDLWTALLSMMRQAAEPKSRHVRWPGNSGASLHLSY